MILFLFLLLLFLPLLLTKEKTSSNRCLSALSFGGRRLDLALTLVVGRGDAGERVGFLLLEFSWPKSACGMYHCGVVRIGGP